jgi:hypothetical protein
MKIISLLFSLTTICFSLNAQQWNWAWARSIGCAQLNSPVYSITTDLSNNVYTTGCFQGTMDFDPGIGVFNITSSVDGNLFISKLNEEGNFVWAKTIGGTGHANGVSIKVDPVGSIYVTGYFYGTEDFDPDPNQTYYITSIDYWDMFVVKLDSSANFLWAITAGGVGFSAGRSLDVDDTGNVYVTGYFENTVDFNPDTTQSNSLTASGIYDVFILKLDATGNFIWIKQIGGSDDDEPYEIKVDADGYIYTTGYFEDVVDFDPGPIIYNLQSAGLKDVFVCKMDNLGNLIWARCFGGNDHDVGSSIAVSQSGNITIAGTFFDTVDFDPDTNSIFNLISIGYNDAFVIRLSSEGNLLWAKSFGGITGDYINKIVLDENENIWQAGSFSSSVDFDPGAGTFQLNTSDGDAFISLMDSSGNFIWAKSAGGAIYETMTNITLDAESRIYITGNFSSDTMYFDSLYCIISDTTLSNSSDIYIARLDIINTGVSLLAEDQLQIFPDPASVELNIHSNMNGSVKLEAYTITGILMLRKESVLRNASDIILDVSMLQNGIYLLKIYYEDKFTVKKFIVSR